MSGICGIFFHDRGPRLNSLHLSQMVRGLDASGQTESFTVSLGSVAMGVQGFPGRLAGIADMVVHGQALALALHGNLYNLRELFPGGEGDDNPCKALLSLYMKDGIAFLQRLRGEFALALWDGLTATLYLASDRFRVHPLFYYQDQNMLVFASRMKAIVACPFPVNRTVDPEAIVDVMASSVIPTPKTIFREVRKLPPGHVLTCRGGEVDLAPYWEISFLEPAAAQEAELARMLKHQLTEAVAIRLSGEEESAHIGCFLSGGVDSSTLTGVLTHLSKRPIKCFSIGFDQEQFNEINYARIAAHTFGAEHYEYFVTPQDAYDIVPTLFETFDEPFANASAIPTYFCARMAREQGVDVLYAGDGGDELFAGNERYATQRLFEYYEQIPTWLRERFLKPLVFGLADGLGWELLTKGKKYIQRASIPYPERLSSYGLSKVIPLPDLLADSMLAMVGRTYNPYTPIDFHYHRAPAQQELDRQLYIDLKLAISDNDLFKVTRATEAVGVTVRYPFLDHHLAEFAAAVPASIKMPGRQLRTFFKKAYADLLPPTIRHKKKHGFGLPLPIWLRTDRPLNELMQDLVLNPRSLLRGYFRKEALEDLVQRHKTDQTSFYGTALWNLMVLELWHRTYLRPLSDLKSSQ